MLVNEHFERIILPEVNEAPHLGIERLRQLAEHLLNGQLEHEVFDITALNEGKIHQRTGCGSIGNAVSECPALFPDHWEFRRVINESGEAHFIPVLKNDVHQDLFVIDHITSAKVFFRITTDEFFHLFYPADFNGDARVERYGGQKLHSESTKEEVAANILEFCRRHEAEIMP